MSIIDCPTSLFCVKYADDPRNVSFPLKMQFSIISLLPVAMIVLPHIYTHTPPPLLALFEDVIDVNFVIRWIVFLVITNQPNKDASSKLSIVAHKMHRIELYSVVDCSSSERYRDAASSTETKASTGVGSWGQV